MLALRVAIFILQFLRDGERLLSAPALALPPTGGRPDQDWAALLDSLPWT